MSEGEEMRRSSIWPRQPNGLAFRSSARAAQSRDVELAEFLPHAVQIILDRGWVSKAESTRTGVRASYAEAVDSFNAGSSVSVDACNIAHHAISYFQDPARRPPKASFITRLCDIACRGKFTESEYSFATALAAEYMKRKVHFQRNTQSSGVTMPNSTIQSGAPTKQPENQAGRQNIHLGAPGKKISGDVRVTRVTPLNGRFGKLYIYTMEAVSNGAQITWMTKTPSSHLKEGDIATILAEVKQHGRFQDVNQTMVIKLEVLKSNSIT